MFQDTQANATADDAVALCIARPSTPMILTKVVLMGVNGMAVQEGFQFQGTVHPAYVIMEHRDLFILYSQYHGC